MNVGKLCRRPAITVHPGDSLAVIARRMREQHVGYLIVVDPEPSGSGARPIGVLTDRDIVTTALAQDVDPRSLTAGDIMNSQPVTIGETDSVRGALQTMRRMGVRRLAVVNSRGELVGVLSLDDVIDVLASEIQEVVGAIRNEQRIEGVQRP
jgi:CBS domain-containing protein